MVYIWPNEMDYYNCICFSWYILLHRFLFHNFNKNKTIKILYNYMTNWPSVTIITLLCWLVTYPKSGQLTTCCIDPENNFHIITTVCFCTTETDMTMMVHQWWTISDGHQFFTKSLDGHHIFKFDGMEWWTIKFLIISPSPST